MNEKELEKMLKALANKRRLAILKVLGAGKEKMVGEISERIKLSFRSTSRHLSILYSAGILDRRQVALQVLYKISSDIPKIASNILSSV